MAELIAYFSRAGENYFNGKIKAVEVGNTQKAAEMLREITGADVVRIQPVHAYSDDYKECVAQAREELQKDARPQLLDCPGSLDGYDTIYLGYPNYCGTMPMPVFTFLEHFDFAGKTVKPFCTNEGSGMGRSESDLKRICTGATVEAGLSIHGAEAASSRGAVEAYVKKHVAE